MAKKTKKAITKESKQESDLTTVVSSVIEQLKPEIQNHIENLRADILSDVQEMTKKNNVPTPKTGVDVSSLISGLQNGNMDLSQLSQFIPQNTPGNSMPKDLDPTQQIEYLKMQNQNQLFMLLPQLLKLFMPQQNDFMNQMMSRIFAEQMSSISMNQRAQSTMMAKMAQDPKLVQQINDNYNALTKPIDDALDSRPVQGVNQNGQSPSK